MLTKEQKKQAVTAGLAEIKKSQSVILVDFNKIPTADLKKLRGLLREVKATFRVIKKRLLKIIFQQSGVSVDPLQFEAQVGTIFSPTDLYGVAGKIYQFIRGLAKEKKDLKVLIAYDLLGHRPVPAEKFTVIAGLPSRAVLLAQVALMVSAPIKKLLIVLNGRKEKISASNS